MKRRERWLAGATTVILAVGSMLGGVVPAAVAADTALFGITKTAVEAGPFAPGDQVTYQITVNCSSTNQGGCDNTVLSDTLPDPLQFNPAIDPPVTVELSAPAGQPIGQYDLDVEGNGFTVKPALDLTASPAVWPGGYSMSVTVNAIVREDADGTWDGRMVTNTATVDADNAPPASSSADIVLDVETTLVAGILKSVSPTSTIPAVAGQSVEWTVVPRNASNQNVDTIVVQDPATPPSAYGYLDVTGYDITDPEGTETRVVQYWVGGGWTDIEPDPLSQSGGIRVSFTGDFAPGASGEVIVHTETNDAVTDIPDQSEVSVPNDASASVSKGGVDSDPVTDDAAITIAQRDPDVSIIKNFDDNSLVSGQSTTANVTATVGSQNVQTLTITEPSAGTATFSEQGLSFDGFGDVEWPVAATTATITYVYAEADCDGTPQTATGPDTLPAPEAECTVEGFTVVYSASGDDIVSGAYATLPLHVTALATETAVSATNAVDTVVLNTLGQDGDAADSAPFTIEPLFIDTSVTKKITPDQIWGVPGTSTDVTLTANVTPDSTAGSEKLVISDPVDPAAGSEFWDTFTPTQIDNTDIPECTSLTLRYWPASTNGPWKDLPDATEIPGPQELGTYPIPTELQGDIGGIQWEYRPLDKAGCPDLLAPGFTVVTHLGVEVTDPHDEVVSVTNDAQSLVDNPAAGGEKTATDTDDVELLPIDDGPGPDFLDKVWLQKDVAALSNGVRTARLLWSTDGLNISEMTLTDVSETRDPTDTEDSVFDAFDLVKIDPITATSDPLIVNDLVTEVSLYLDGTGWTDITDAACALGCDGAFGGYALSADESADALAVRVVLTEKTAGAGVGASYERRPFDLDFRLRDTLRSDPDAWVLGDLHDGTYNTEQPGLVENDASAHGVNEATGVDATDIAADSILIIDRPINANITKQFDQDQLGLPELGEADPDDYPLISATLTATNGSAARVAGMVIQDPAVSQVDPTAFDTLNLFDIDAIRRPSAITEEETTVTLLRGVTPTDYTYAEALALDADDLADVTGIVVAFRSADGHPVIPSTASGAVTLTWQLRDVLRSDPSTPVTLTPPGESILNEAQVQLETPALQGCADNQCGTGFDDASDEFQIVDAGYTIETTKSITPESIYEDESSAYVTRLGGRPNGPARTTFFSLTDTTPTFWNTMDYAGAQITVPQPVNQVAMDVLVDDDASSDVEYTVDAAGVLVATCNGVALADTSPCWTEGEWVDAAASATVSFGLPSGVNDDETVVGVRFRAQSVNASGDVVQWERPFNPQLTFLLSTDRRDTLRSEPSTLVSTTRPDLDPNPGETDRGVISNTVESYSTAQFGADQTFDQEGDAAYSTVVRHRTNAVKITKTRGGSALVSAAGTIPYVITVTNTGEWDMTGLQVVDEVETDAAGSLLVEPTPKAYTFALSGPGAPSGDPGFSASLDPASGELTITSPDDFVFESKWVLTVSAPLRFRSDVSPDTTVGNTVTVTSDRLFETCEGTTVENGRDLTPKPIENTPPGVAACSADTEITPLAAATISAKKYVKGAGAGDPAVPADDDLGVLNVAGPASACDASQPGVTNGGYYSYPCAPITRPGGVAKWRLDFTNTGNTSARVIAALDTLPTVGDQGIIVPGDRGSQFPVTLTGEMIANFEDLADSNYLSGGILVSPVILSQECNTNAIKVFTENATPLPQCDYQWAYSEDVTTPEQLAAIRTFMIVLVYVNGDETTPRPGLRPGETLRVTYDTQTPYVLPKESADPQGLPIAYNSFATSSRSNATPTQPERPSLVTEPQKVGIGAATGQLELSKSVEAPDYAVDIDLPENYPMLVTCTSGGQPVTLLSADGSDASRPLVAADDTTLVYASGSGPVNLPLFSTCTVKEDPVEPGVVVSVDPAAGVTAERDFSRESSIWDPYVGDTEQAAFAITNTYAAGGFSVAKSVDNGGAENQDGELISYDRTYTFTASCLYLEQETIPTADREFTLKDGASPKVFSDIPAGASCTVRESENGGAAETSFVVTEDGTAGEQQTASVVEFTVLPYADDSTTALTVVDVTNSYTVGAVEVTKNVAGAGDVAWGNGPFTLAMTCTLDDVTPDPVFEDSQTVTRQEPVWLVSNLPTGAECTVTETAAGGANSTSAPVVVIVGDSVQEPIEATITNTFTVGSLRVDKALEGAPSATLDPATTDEYLVNLSCTRVVNGSTVDVIVPLGATRTITGEGSALYQGLPTGALCTVTESDTGHATSHTISPDQPVTIGSGEEPVIVSLTNEFANGSISVAKTVDAPEGFPVPAEFTATVSCTWYGAEVPLADDGRVTLVAGDAPVVIDDVPVGSLCSVAEDDLGQTATTITPESITVDEADETFALTIENTYEWASLTVGKIVESATEEVPTQFVFSIECTFQGETVLDVTVPLNAGEVAEYTELPARSECTIRETDDRGADGTMTEASVPGAEGPNAPVIDQETRTVVIPELTPDTDNVVNTVTYTNLFDTAGLLVTKDLQGAGSEQFGSDKTFVAGVTCVYEGEQIVDEQLELNAANGWTAGITDVVAGAECTIVESDLNGADAVVVTPNDGEDTTVGVVVVPEPDAESPIATVSVTNWFLTGSLEVTKSFAGDAQEKFGTDEFELRILCVRDGELVRIPGGNLRTVDARSPMALWENLPTGSLCSLRETDAGGANSTRILDAEGNAVAGDGEGYSFTVDTDPTILSVDDQPQPALTVENTFNFAQVSVTKVVESAATGVDGAPIIYGPFEVELACEWNGGPVEAAEAMTRPIADGESVTWTELPEGAECSVTETDTAGAESTTAVITESGVEGEPQVGTVAELTPLPNVDAEDQTSVLLTNTFAVASLTISKVVDGTDAARITRTFPVEVTCVLIDASHPDPGLVVHDASYQVGGPDRRTVDIENLPAGSVCHVTETDDGGADRTTVIVNGVPQPGADGSVTLVSGSAVIVITNTFTLPLPATGVDTQPLLIAAGVAGVLIVGGVILMMVLRRRRQD